MLKNYLKIAWRNLFKHKVYTFINIMGLAVGIAVCMLIFNFISYELSYDAFHDKADRIYRIATHLNQNDLAVSPSVVSPVLQKQLPEVETGVRVYASGRFSPVVVRHQNKVFEEQGFGYADSTFFEVFSFKLLRGNGHTALNRPGTMVISQAMADKYFSGENPIGQSLTVNNKRQFEITGVMENIPDNSHFQMDFIASLVTLSSWSELDDDELHGAQFYTYIVLRKKSSRAETESQISALFKGKYPDAIDTQFSLQPLTDIHLHSSLEAEIQPQGDIQYVWAAAAIAILILIIACINYMNLATARSVRRAREVGVRKVLGSDRSKLIAQFYGESAFITFLSILLSLLLIEFFNPWFNQLVGQHIDIPFMSLLTLSLLAGMGAVITLFAGSYPALLLSSFKPSAVLKGSQSKKRNNILRKGLVIFQFTVSVILIVSTLIIYQQVNYVQHKELGYKKDNVLVLTSYPEVEERFNTFNSLLQQQPGIQEATMLSETPTNINGGYTIDVEGVDHSERNIITGLRAWYNFTEALDINMVAGRSFTKTDYERANPKEGNRKYAFLINEAMADYLGLKPDEALGRRTKVNGRMGSIIGVVENFHFTSLHEKIGPLVIFLQADFNKLLVRLNTNNSRQALANTREVWQRLFPDYPFQYKFLDQEYDALYTQENRAGKTFSYFAFIAIFIACLGLLGLSAYTVEQRAKEIGIRKVLGASVWKLVFLLSKDFSKLVLISIGIAIPVGWWLMSSWLQDFAYRINIEVWHFALAGALALAIAWLTVSWQSIRAALANPVDSLRSE